MYLKSLELNGFKSFGKKGELAFTSPISAIVGPNGSGKSNVAEAFRFVLGEQSLKSMRGKRGEDLIFNGTEALSRQNRASVKVVFDNSKRDLPIDFEEVSIERVVHRDGVNEYFINSSQVRLKDIQELLSHAHIGASGHHIISQGEADRILSANLRERRAMLEDALGLKIFQYKKLESERKLEKTEENMRQVESLRRELAPHLKFLRKQVEKIEKAESLREELKSLYKEYLKREEDYIRNSYAAIDSELQAPNSELQSINASLEEIRKNLSSKDSKDQAKAELIDLERRQRGIMQETERLSHESGRIDGEIRSLERFAERERKALEEEGNIRVLLTDVEKTVGESFNHFSRAEAENSLDLFKSAYGTVRDLWSGFFSSHREKVRHEGLSYEEDILKLEVDKNNLGIERQKLENELNTLEEKIVSLKKQIVEKSEGDLESEREMFRLMTRQSELSGKITEIKSRRNSLVIEEDEWKREITEACLLIGREMMNYAEVMVTKPDPDREGQRERRRTIEKMKIRLEELGLGSAEEVMKEYRETEERDSFLERELGDLQKAGEDLRNLIRDLEHRIDTEFKEGIQKINREFQKYFELLFGGGRASLAVIEEKNKDDTAILEDMDNVGELGANTNQGIDIQVDLPKKKVKALMMLSGGERALTSIALLFAMSQVNPPPFIILDETDAALDEANSRKYGDMIENLSKYSQLIVITHNRETMSRAGVIYGVTQISGLSKLLSIKFDEALAVAK